MPSEDQILLKLVIQGQDPAEIQRLAASTQGQLNDRMKVYLDHLTQLHRQAAQAQTAEAVNASKKQIDAAEKQVDVVAKVMRANEIAANRAGNAWKGTLEVMENIATSATFMFGVISSGLSRLNQLAESIDKVTNVYGSLKGSIDQMRESSRGEISDYDLITTKNRALEKDLQLTDTQFGAVAAAADNFADSLGIDTKHALDQIIDGLATGRVKMLEHAGVVINVDDAYKKYAKSIGVAVDQLNDHGKKIAVVRESLRAMDQKLADSGKSVDNFSHNYEKMVAEFKNHTDHLLLYLGEVANKIFEVFETTLPRAIRHSLAAIQDSLASNGALGNAIKSIPGIGPMLGIGLAGSGSTHNLADQKAFDAIEDRNRQAERNKAANDAAARLAAGTSYGYQQGTVADSVNQKKVAEDAKAFAAAVKAAQDKYLKEIEAGDKAFRGPLGRGTPSILMALAGMPGDVNLDDFTRGRSDAAAPRGLSGGLARQSSLQKSFSGKSEKEAIDVDRQQAEAAATMAKLNEDAMTEMMDKADKLRERAGNGIFATLLFGPSGREELLDDIDSFKNAAGDAMGMVADAGMKMAEALGASMAAFVSGDKNKRKSIRDTTHDILEALSAQAYSRAIFETAEGLASLALGPIGGVSAGMHFAAAGMFAAVGTAAGVGARGVGQSATGGMTQDQKFQQQHDNAEAKKQFDISHGYSSGGVSSSGGSSFGSGGMRSSSSGGGGDGTVIFNINAPLGDRAEIGRGVALALSEYYSQSGRGIPLSPGSI